MSKVLIAVDDLNVVNDLQAMLREMPTVQVVGVVANTNELRNAVARLRPQAVLVGERLGPEPVEEVIRDFLTLHADTAMVELVAARTPQNVVRAMEAGARAVLGFPLVFEEVNHRLGRAIEYAEQMHRALIGAEVLNRRKGSLVTVVGAKGGVGTTTMALHLAADQLRCHENQQVCVVDVDVEKGDVAAMLDIRQSVSIADVSRVSGDLSPNTVLDAVIHHESGLRVLLAPQDVRESGTVTAESVRAILEILRREFDVVIVDGGAQVSPAQAAAVEISDTVVVVTTADALAMRCFRKRALAWDGLGVRDEADLKLLVNKVDKSAIFPVSAVPRLTVARVLETSLPNTPRALELASNDRDPRAVTEVAWWRLMSAIRQEVGLEPGEGEQQTSGRAKRGRKSKSDKPAKGVRGRRQLQEALPPAQQEAPQPDLVLPLRGERGAIAIEHAAIIPVALGLAILGWQGAVLGLATLYNGHATSHAARAYALTGSTAEATAAARAAVPGPFDNGLVVSAAGDTITVSHQVPGSLGMRIMDRVSSTQTVVRES